MVSRSETIRILHVDDEPDLTELAATFLEREDDRIVVETASSAADGLDVLDDFAADCIVSDYDMPGRNGIEFLKAVRERHPELPVILYTGKGSEEVASEAISAGVTEYMQKEAGTDQYTVLANRITNSVEQYRARQAAERTRERLTELSESTTDCLWMFDREWEELVFISGYEDVWNRSESAIRDDPRDFLYGVHPDDRALVEDAMARLSNGETIDVEFRILRGDDDPGAVWMKGEPVRDDEGAVVRVVGFTRDITERREQRRRLETLISNLPGIAYRCRNEPGWPMEFVRGECETLTGYTADAIERGDVDWSEDVLHPEDSEDMWNRVQDAVDADRPFEVTYRIRTKDGDTRWMWERGQMVDATGQDTEILEGFITDITERRRRERELERYEAYLQESTDIITVLDADGTVKYQSPAVTRILGYEPGELLGKSGFDYVHPEDVDTVRAAFAELAGEPEGTITVECRFRTADGGWRWLEVNGSNQLDTEPINGIVTNNRDITDRKKREQELESILHEMDDAIFVHPDGGPFTFVNQAAVERYGYTEAELHTMTPADLNVPSEPGEVAERVQAVMASGQAVFETEHRTRSGETIPVEINATTVTFHGDRSILSIVRDISERKSTEHESQRPNRD
ncbi:putative PAS/PAC sensor protein [Halorhabdus utahensis DSM 12940]|uniref:histidine kinase n=1 Tax=Halorhabdus utahensis (strain DSM 12940 / JCM 11049 / AX-2) TaxID=519442 RepID=C7NSH4_HALUD|nr:putative PAS/PAC sensor protein [Halorhabdus utahensis DSM 12940]